MSAPYDTEFTSTNLPIREQPNRAEEVDGAVDPAIALSEAAATGDTTRLRALLELTVDVDAVDARGFTALHHAASAGRTAAVAILLDAGASADLPSSHGGACTGTTPLLCAIAGEHGDVVRQLLAAAASPDRRDDAGFTPLHLAATVGSADIVKALVLEGCSLDPMVGDVTPLDLARRGRHLAVVGLLLQVGAH